MEKLRGLKHLLVTVFLSGFSGFVFIPAITDVTMSALCPGRDECSLAIYLSGLQQAMIGAGAVVMMPVIGNLSDQYGRKTMLTLPMTVSIIPLVILAYSRETKYFYAYYVLRTLTAMVSEGSTYCLALAYVTDTVPERHRASTFGILAGVTSASFVCGTLAARFLSTGSTFQVAAAVSMVAVVYMRIFLQESINDCDGSKQPLVKAGPVVPQQNGEAHGTPQIFKKVPSVGDLICLLRTSATFSKAVVVSFFNSLAEGGMQACLMYFLKAQFHFNKNQFADLMLIVGVAGTISQLLFMPLLLHAIGEEKLLPISLLVGCTNMVLNSIAWSVWVPYVVAVFAAFAVLATPCIRSIASKQVGPSEQGKAQGCISGISSFANIVSPLIFSPLAALFLSDDPPFPFPGFSIMCLGFALMIALIQSIMIRPVPPTCSQRISNESSAEP